MRYEKKMLILSGEGKGVVLIEKSGLGVRFALRTFGLRRRTGLMAGVITRTATYVRELPDTDDPSAVFYLDCDDIDALHFAVFDSALVLYGAIGKKLWEANVLGLLRRRVRPELVPPPALPPLVTKSAALPLPDGTGIPQSRDAIYGDDALVEKDFYTQLDLSRRMPVVDGFLDTPRVLDGLSPTIERCDGAAAAEPPPVEAAVEPTSEPTPVKTPVTEAAACSDAQDDTYFEGREVSEKKDAGARAAAEPEQALSDAAQDGSAEEPPWASEARYLKGLCTRPAIEPSAGIKPPDSPDAVTHIRDADFFERCRGDVDGLFAAGARDGALSELLSDIEWVKVPFYGHTVSVGRGSAFLCYAVSGIYKKVSPLGEEAQWLPERRSEPTGRGYWLVFQDLVSGEIMRTE